MVRAEQIRTQQDLQLKQVHKAGELKHTATNNLATRRVRTGRLNRTGHGENHEQVVTGMYQCRGVIRETETNMPQVRKQPRNRKWGAGL